MPITLSPISRRRFLLGTLAAGAGVMVSRYTWADTPADGTLRFALLSDTHINADLAKVDRRVNMHDHLKQAIDEVLALQPAPLAMIVNGDCAHLMGNAEDYQQFFSLIDPIHAAGVPVHLAMGNHDDRQNFWQAAGADASRVKAMDDRQILIIETPIADWIMLDSLDKTNSTPGLLGAPQLTWLAAELDRRANRRIIVMVHHEPDTSAKVSGLLDTTELLGVLQPRKQVKALLFGHTHEWSVEKRDDLPCINLPAVSYVFKTGEPSGWVDAHVTVGALELELHCLDKAHPKNAEKHMLAWRG
jgi:3',5'-cyclic AMP phosphodiesterase CpdA